MKEPQRSYRAVIFDLGGVVLGSPLHAIAAHEKARGIPSGFVNRVVAESAPHGAWSRLERGELALAEFFPAFEADCLHAGHELDAADLFASMEGSSGPRAEMLRAIATLRACGYATGALTNNWALEAEGTSGTRAVRHHFDVFVESSVEGLRKPDPAIYHLACERLGVTPSQSVFLDDIGTNLKAARALGMTTIKVVEPAAALAELERVLGISLG